MASRSKQRRLPEWRAYDWPESEYQEIKENLLPWREIIAELLEIELNDFEVVRGTARRPKPGDADTADDDVPVDPSQIEFADRTDLVLEDIAIALVNFLGDLSNLNNRASLPQIRRILAQLSKRDLITEDEIELLDGGVRHELARHYPGGWERFAPGLVMSEDVRAAAQAALATIPKPKRGRPRGRINHAARNLANEISIIYERHGDKRAARSVLYPSYRDAGRFLEFFQIAVDALPEIARKGLTHIGGGIASLARYAVQQRNPSPGS